MSGVVHRMRIDGKKILITGGTGSLGQAMTHRLLTGHKPAAIRIFSRDEWKQSEMRRACEQRHGAAAFCLRWLLGDVRDRERLLRAFDGVDIVIHAAALKQVPALEYNPFEAVLTNVLGTRNVVDAAVDCGVQRVVMASTDKAVSPTNLYGATKLLAERIVVQGNIYGGKRTRFAVCRYGNVAGSRGSVLPLFQAQAPTGALTITDERMTRFWTTMEQALTMILAALSDMSGGEVFVPKIPSIRIMDLAAAVAPQAKLITVGIRAGEKLHETLISADEARTTIDAGRCYVIRPQYPFWDGRRNVQGKLVPEGWSYTSDGNQEWLTVEDLRKAGGVT